MLHTSDILLLDIKKPQTFYTTEPNHNFVLLLAQEILKRSINIFHFLKNHLVFFFYKLLTTEQSGGDFFLKFPRGVVCELGTGSWIVFK